ncbi:MAG TPA: hypothetical protein PKH40_10605 [Treponemataceae bacterium]|jgi:hypothetical protein|nr:hypothetical protein [Treponemataceae bacterium]HPX46588.1 hypothetical protein [Treponemataceae bacterium]HQL33435.1 hypothetical protein [Treponemataceae bacterium]
MGIRKKTPGRLQECNLGYYSAESPADGLIAITFMFCLLEEKYTQQ